MYESLFKVINLQTTAGKTLHKTALTFLGTDASPNDYAPDELGCAETVNNIVYAAFGDYAGGDLSTYRMYKAIKNNRKFIQVSKPLYGDIILSPTGYGNGKIVGHTGIVSYGDAILSNDSRTGVFSHNFSQSSWQARYTDKGGLPTLYFRRISY